MSGGLDHVYRPRTTRKLRAGQMLVLAAGEPHSLVGLEDSSVLVTKSSPAAQPPPETKQPAPR